MRGGITQIGNRDWEQRWRENCNWAGKNIFKYFAKLI